MDNRRNASRTKSFSFKIASASILTALTVVMTLIIRIPMAPTRGYINLGDVAIFFAAVTFGPAAAFIAGGIGTAIADIISGYSQWALFSFLIHGLQGAAAGALFRILYKKENKSSGIISASSIFLAGSIIMAGGYFITGSFMTGIGAAITEIPMNIIQNGVGTIGGYLLSFSVKKAYPPVINFKW